MILYETLDIYQLLSYGIVIAVLLIECWLVLSTPKVTQKNDENSN